MEDAISKAIRSIVRQEIRAALDSRSPAANEEPLFNPQRMYSVKSAAELLEVSEDYILTRIKDGTFARIVDLGSSRSKYRISASELAAFTDLRAIMLR